MSRRFNFYNNSLFDDDDYDTPPYAGQEQDGSGIPLPAEWRPVPPLPPPAPAFIPPPVPHLPPPRLHPGFIPPPVPQLPPAPPAPLVALVAPVPVPPVAPVPVANNPLPPHPDPIPYPGDAGGGDDGGDDDGGGGDGDGGDGGDGDDDPPDRDPPGENPAFRGRYDDGVAVRAKGVNWMRRRPVEEGAFEPEARLLANLNDGNYRVRYRRGRIVEDWIYRLFITNFFNFFNDDVAINRLMADFMARARIADVEAAHGGNAVRMQFVMRIHGGPSGEDQHISTAFFLRPLWLEAWRELMDKFDDFYDLQGRVVAVHRVRRQGQQDQGRVRVLRMANVTRAQQMQIILGLQIEFHIRWVRIYTGGSITNCGTISAAGADLILRRKRCIIRMKNTDGLCFSRSLAILLSRAYQKQRTADDEDADFTVLNRVCKERGGSVFEKLREIDQGWGLGAYYKRVKDGKRQLQLAKILHGVAAVPEGFVGIDTIPRFEKVLGISVRVYDLSTGFHCIYDGSSGDGSDRFPIFRLIFVPSDVEDDGDQFNRSGHFHPLTSYRALFGKSYECNRCDVVYDARNGHKRCSKVCGICKMRGCDSSTVFSEKTVNWIKCEDCNRWFPSENCFERHKAEDPGPSTCSRLRVCGRRGCKPFNPAIYVNGVQHQCGDKICTYCKRVKRALEKHECFIQTATLKEPRNKFIFFDLECTADPEEDFRHVITHAIAQYGTCESGSYFRALPSPSGDISSVGDEFCTWLFQAGVHKGFTAIAHNGKGYDFQFILKWCVDRDVLPSKCIRDGSKIRYMEVSGVRFVDSLSFLAMPLSRFVATFELEEMRKGYFPHLFNLPENQTYCGPYPPIHFYSPDNMPENARSAFIEWYEEKVVADEVFDFQKEIVTYCESDVDILRMGCTKFRDLFLSIAGVDPFSYITIAGVAMSVFRSKFLIDDTIAVIDVDIAKKIRSSFCGGRTCVMQAFARSSSSSSSGDTDDGKVKYVDITSLYPWVNATQEYPLGHYEHWDYTLNPITEAALISGVIQNVFGFICVDVEPPTDLLHPVLPEKKHSRLMFDLEPKARQFFSSMELKKAVEKGYVVTKLYEAVHWPKTTKTLFKGYVDTFLKLKMESAGWFGREVQGRQVVTDDEKQQWCDTYFLAQGVRVDPNAVTKNPGMYAVSKLMLNSLWGKFGQRPIQDKVKFEKEASKIYPYFSKFEVRNLTEVGSGAVHEIVFRDAEDGDRTSHSTNVAIAAITTAWARLKLYNDALDVVGPRAIYCDTDSIVYKYSADGPNIALGSYLGEWTDELGGDFIQEFVASGPKMYSYVTAKGKVDVKCKGFRLSFLNSRNVLNFGNIKKSVVGYHDADTSEVDLGDCSGEFKSAVSIPLLLKRDRVTKDILTVQNATKQFRATLENKGVVCPHTLRVLPFGYSGEYSIDSYAESDNSVLSMLCELYEM